MNYEKPILIGLIIILAGLYIQNNIVSVYPNLHGNDFAHLYLGSYLATQHKSFYSPELLFPTAQALGIQHLNPFVYPPIVALFFIPLSLFSYPDAQLVWFICNHLFLILSFLFIILSFNSKNKLGYIAVSLLISFSFAPLYRTLTAGQLNLFILFLISLAWYLYTKKKPVGAGVILAIATLTKLFPGLLILFFLWKKEYRVAISAIAAIIILVLLSLMIQGVSIYQDYGPLLIQMSYGQSTWSQFQQRFDVEPANQSFHALVLRLFSSNPVTSPIIDVPGLAKIVSALFSIVIIIISFWVTYPKKNQKISLHTMQTDFSLLLITALLISSLLWDHYLVYFFLILLCLFDFWLKSDKISLKSITYISILYLIMAIQFNFWSDLFRSDIGILLMSFKFYPVILIWIYLVLLIHSNKSSTPIVE
ncbi:MAG: glycosyltransferase family 87 protein [bacterium]